MGAHSNVLANVMVESTQLTGAAASTIGVANRVSDKLMEFNSSDLAMGSAIVQEQMGAQYASREASPTNNMTPGSMSAGLNPSKDFGIS